MKDKEDVTTYQKGDQVLVFAGEKTFFGKSLEMLAEVTYPYSYYGCDRALVEIVEPCEAAAGYYCGDKIRVNTSSLTKL
jgi:hypothetical protein